MKKVIVFLSITLLLFTSCEQGVEIKADFIYLEDAAVLKGTDFIYGVKIDTKAKELAKRIESIKVDEFDMVPVVVMGVINKKAENEEGWEEVVTIKKIVSVSDNPSQPDVKLEQ
jgi:hypothetical protein